MKKNVNKKTSRKNTSFLSKFIPTTRKSRYLTLALVFAVVGSVVVFRSFALDLKTNITRQWTYNVASGNLTAVDRTTQCEPNQGPKTPSVVTETFGKNTASVIEAKCYTNYTGPGEGAASSGAVLDSTSSGRRIRACFWARAVEAPSGEQSNSKGQYALIKLVQSGVTLESSFKFINKTPSYNEYCTLWADSRGSGRVDMIIQQDEPGVMRVQQIILYEGIKSTGTQPTQDPGKNPQQTPAPTPPPAPSPTK